MTNVLIDNEKLISLASAIRLKGNTNLSYTISTMASAINNFQKTGYTYEDVAYGTLGSTIYNTTITSINSYAFRYTQLISINFTNCSSINSHAFGNCFNLTTAIFPICKQISDYAFFSCSNLTTISFPQYNLPSNNSQPLLVYP